MPRPKKDGEKVSLYLNREMMDELRRYADDKGQTLTTAMERIITGFLKDEYAETMRNNRLPHNDERMKV